MLKKILIAVLAIVAVLCVLITLQPSTFKVTRSTTIAAPPEAVFALVNDYHKWEAWSPWAKIDPNVKTTYSGADSGQGAIYSWAGNSDVGEGRMTTLESRSPSYMKIKLEFLKPFESTSLAEFHFKPEGAGTVVSWDMYGDANFMTKAMTLFASMDSMVGADFEKGLRQMKALAEGSK